MCCGFVGIVAEGTFLYRDAGKEEEGLLKCSDVFFFELTHEHLWCPAGVAAVLALVFDFAYAFVKLSATDLQTAAEGGCVPVFAHLPHRHCDFVNRLIEDEQLSVSVVNKATGRINSLFDQRVVIGLVFG